MAFSIVQSILGADSTSGASSTLTLNISAAGSGNTLMGMVEYSNGALTAPSSIVAGSNTLVLKNHLYDSTNDNGAFMFEGVNIIGGATSIVVTWAVSTVIYRRMAMLEVAGIAVFDNSNAATQTLDSSHTAVSSGNIAVQAVGEFLYGTCVNTSGGQSITFTAGSGYVKQNSSAGLQNSPMADETQTYSGSSPIAAGFTVTAAFSYYTGIMAFTSADLMGYACL